MHPVDVAMATLAARQQSLFTVQQVIAAGGDRSLVRRRVNSGHWLRHGPCVLGFPGSAPTFERQLRLGLLDAGADAMASHEASARFHDLAPFPERLAILVGHGRHHRNCVGDGPPDEAAPRAGDDRRVPGDASSPHARRPRRPVRRPTHRKRRRRRARSAHLFGRTGRAHVFRAGPAGTAWDRRHADCARASRYRLLAEPKRARRCAGRDARSGTWSAAGQGGSAADR